MQRWAADWTAREASLRRLPLRVVHVSPWSRADLADLWPYRPEALPGCPAAAITCRCPRLRVEAVRLTGCPVPALTAETGPCGSRQYRGADVRPDEVALGVDARDPVDVAVCFAFEAARRRSARVRAVHAWELPCPADGWMPFAVPEADRATWEDEQVQMLSDALRPWREKYPQIPVLKDVLRFTAAAALVRESMRTELLVVGRRSPALGPVVDVVRHGRCPFAVVPL